MPAAVIFSAPGMSTSRPPTWMLNLPGTLNASRMLPPLSAASAFWMSTTTSKVPSRPVSFAVMPLLDWPEAPPEPPKARLAESTPMAMVSVSFMSLNCVLASVTDGPSSDSGPMLIAFEAVPAVCCVAETVNTSSVRTPASALALLTSPTTTPQLPATNCTLTSPATNMSFGSTPALVASR
jgi:hypothetical protein